MATRRWKVDSSESAKTVRVQCVACLKMHLLSEMYADLNAKPGTFFCKDDYHALPMRQLVGDGLIVKDA